MQLVQSTKSVSNWRDKGFTSKGKGKKKLYLHLNVAENYCRLIRHQHEGGGGAGWDGFTLMRKGECDYVK